MNWEIVDCSHFRILVGSSFFNCESDGGWINEMVKWDFPNAKFCAVGRCFRPAMVGTHIEMYDQEGLSLGLGIIPMCYDHNLKEARLGESHQDKRYVDGKLLVPKKIISRVWKMPTLREGYVRILEEIYPLHINGIKNSDWSFTIDRWDFRITSNIQKDFCSFSKYFEK